MQNAIRLPFDGMAKNTTEVAKMIGDILKAKGGEKVHIIVPTQWAWDLVNVVHPVGGVLTILNQDTVISKNYKLACFRAYGEIGVTATPY